MRVIIFDMDDTLIVDEASAANAFMDTCRLAETAYGIEAEMLYPVIRRASRELWHKCPVRNYCLEIGISSWEGLWAGFEGNSPETKILAEWAPYYRFNSWKNALTECGIENSHAANLLADAFISHRRLYHALYDDALKCLENIPRDYSLALITNGTPELQWGKIKATGIEKYFKEIIISGEVGYGKPDKRIFQLTLSRFGVSPEQAIMVGDSLQSDISGAKAAGIKTIWLNRKGAAIDNTIIPDIEISGLGQLRKYL